MVAPRRPPRAAWPLAAALLLLPGRPAAAQEASAEPRVVDDAQEFSCVVDYGRGKGSWESMWSDEQKEYCCREKGLACPRATSKLFDCAAGLANWKRGWSVGKKVWCCQHEGKACVEEKEDPPSKPPATKIAVHEMSTAELAELAKIAKRAQAEAVAKAAQTEACGVSAVLDAKGRFKPTESLQPVCGRQLATNCSVSYTGMTCPSGCEYLVPNHHFVCLFECVPARRCSASNANRAWPDPATHICSHCSLEGCQVCESAATCAKCHEGFNLKEDGSGCEFGLDASLHTNAIGNIVWAFLAVAIVLGVVWRRLKGEHENKETNLAAIARARRHRHMCKVQDWRLGNRSKVRERYPLTEDLHKVHILGVGLPLFYNSVCFLALIALISYAITYTAYRNSNVSLALATSDASGPSTSFAPIQVTDQAPALVLSPLAPCGQSAEASDILDQLKDFATTNFYAIGALYVITFGLSLLHGRMQLSAANRYDERNKTMSDYALRVTGLRRGLTDEAALAAKLQEAFQQACPRNSEDGLAPVEVIGVSICYDYSKVKDEVESMKDRFMERMDLDLQQRLQQVDEACEPAGEDIAIEGTSAQDLATMRRLVEEDRGRAQAWFDEGSVDRLHSTGEAFVVFRRIVDRNAVWAQREEACRHAGAKELLASSEDALRLFQVFSEPPSINWWHLATSANERNSRIRCAMLKILGIIAAVQVLIVLPYAWYIVWPYSSTGSSAGGTKMQIAGMILGNINTFVSLQIFFTSYGLGFHRKDAVDMMVLCSNTALVMVNTLFNIVTTALMVFSQADDSFGPGIFLTIESLTSIGTESHLAANIYHLLMPGSFFVGYLICIVMAGIVPYVWKSVLMKVIYVWRCLPDPLLKVLKALIGAGDLTIEHYPFRHAEKSFEPMEVGISWDYSSMIVTPTVCFCMLFFVSPYVYQTFLMMLVSCGFYYCFCRFLHLRFCKACFYTTNRLDTMAKFLWGIPLSVIAAAWCVWGIRSEHFLSGAGSAAKFGLVMTCFCASLVSWVFAYWRLLRPWSQEDANEEDKSSFEQVKADLLYSWFNCNPVYVLKCEYYYQDGKRHSDSFSQNPSNLKVTMVGAKNLRDADWIPSFGASDPRCVCRISSKPHAKLETPAHHHEHNPLWNFSGELPQFSAGDVLEFIVLDKDMIKRDDVLGKATVPAAKVLAGFEGDLELDVSGKSKATLQVRISPPRAAPPQTKVLIERATGLRDADWMPGASRSDPYVVCDVVGKPEAQVVTPDHEHKTEPVWNFETGINLDANDSLVFTIKDKDVLKSDDVLGKVKVSASRIRKGLDCELPLEEAGQGINAKIKLRIQPPGEGLRPVSTARRNHPMACGEDPHRVSFYEVGKEYLFVSADKQDLVVRELRGHLEFETYLEDFFAFCSKMVKPVAWVVGVPPTPKSPSAPLPAILKQSSREVLLKGDLSSRTSEP